MRLRSSRSISSSNRTISNRGLPVPP
jgi:hypothetical protein